MRPRLKLVMVLGVMLAAVAGFAVTAHAAPTVIFAEEFNGTAIDKTKWTQLTPWGTHYTTSELQYYRDQNVTVANGSARITTEKLAANGYQYQSGILTTPRIYSYGYYEVRAKMPQMGKGVWPAIWLLADGQHEIDILEMPGYGTANDVTDVYMTYHFLGGGQTGSMFKSPVDMSLAYHTYAVDWQPTYIKWYIDGVERKAYYGNIPSNPQSIILNTSLGGAWPPSPDASTPFPQYYDIDYVRVYSYKPTATAPVNTAPVAVANSYSTNAGTSLNIAAPGVLANDSDADGNALTASVVTQPVNGTVALATNGGFVYTPRADFSGTDAFTYRVFDGTAYSSAVTVSITVNAPTTPTVPTVPTAPTAPGLLYADEFNGPLDAMVWASLTPWNTRYTTGELAYYDAANVSFVDGRLRIKSEQRYYSGWDYMSGVVTSLARQKFSYGYFEMSAKLPKGKGVSPTFWLTNDSTMELGVARTRGDAPGRVYMSFGRGGSQVYGTSFDGPDTSVGYHTYAIDWQPTYVKWYVDGVLRGSYTGAIPSDPMYISLGTSVGGTFAGSPDLTTPFPQYFDVEYMRVYSAKPAVVAPVVNADPVAVADSYSVNAGTSLTIAAPGVLANDTDADGNTLTASVVTQPTNGTVTLSADGSLVYVPRAGFSGADSFTYRAFDGKVYSTAATVSITVNAVNRAPIASGNSYVTDAGKVLIVAAPGVLSNDSDADGDTLTASAVTQPLKGSLSMNADGSFVYTPAPGFFGTDPFTYRVFDGKTYSAAVTVGITVNAVNRAPVAVGNTYTATAGTTLTVAAPGVLGNDTDADGDALTVAVVSYPVNGTLALSANGSFTYVPAAGFAGTDTFTYRVSDGSVASGIATVTLVVDPAPAPTPIVKRKGWYKKTYTVSGTVPTAVVAETSYSLVPASFSTATTAVKTPVRIQVQRYRNGRWSAYRTVSHTATNGRYSMVLTLRRGTFRLRAVPAAGPTVAPSRWRKIKVA